MSRERYAEEALNLLAAIDGDAEGASRVAADMGVPCEDAGKAFESLAAALADYLIEEDT